MRGIGRLAGLEILQVPGITGYFDTNYEGKASHALTALDEGYDVVIVHVESTDEAGHMGDAKKKIQAIEDVDSRLVAPLLHGLKKRGGPFSVLVVPDHPTSTALRTHVADAVPFAMYASSGGTRDGVSAYTETAVRASAKTFEQGFELMRFFLTQGQSA
ncbi:MAG: alkaline phosphatase family protein [Candidatus Omnitrophica bacterium]|nr:alkaline phosphatase family protein [Candidatus Omnitrophota bacterium]